MLNKVILSGRITRDLEVRQTNSGSAVVQFTLAVERNFSAQNGERLTDFITCVAWGKTAEFIGRFFSKGRSIAVIGSLRTRTYDDKNGTKHYVTEVNVDEAQFTFEPKPQNGSYGSNSYGNNGGYGGYNNNNNYGGYGQQNNSGYQQGGGYNGGGYGSQQSAPSQAPAPANNGSQPDDAVNIGDFQDFEVFSDDGVPF